MLSLLYHFNCAGPAFVRADAAAFAIIHVRHKKSIFTLLNASFGAKNVADAALDAFRVVPDGPLRPPASRMVLAGAARLGHNTANGKFPPCL
jgi:hypothetical protein